MEQVRPSVVTVMAEVVTGRDFFTGAPITDFSSGTGVIFDPQGYILTNNHVVDDAIEVEVTLDSGEQLPVQVIGVDALVDLAVLKVDLEEGYPAAPLGSATDLRVGDWVIAIGNALALPGGPTVTVGVVSALGRSVPVTRQVTLYDMIQTDTAINPGNSGGPLVNLNGEVVGINTAVFRGNEAEGIGFAINMNTAIPAAHELMEAGRIRWAFLGVVLGDLDSEAAARADIPVREGVIVVDVSPGGAAGQAGVLAGDIILSIDGNPTPTLDDLIRMLRFDFEVGQMVELRVFRGGEELTLEVTLGERPA